MRVGERYNGLCEPLRLFGTVLQQVQQMKYLGVCLVSDKKLKCDVNHLKVKFYRAFNCMPGAKLLILNLSLFSR